MSRPLSERTLRSYYAHAQVEGDRAASFALELERRARHEREHFKPGSARVVAADGLARAARQAVREGWLRDTQGHSEDARNGSEGLVSAVSAEAMLAERSAKSQGAGLSAGLGVAW